MPSPQPDHTLPQPDFSGPGFCRWHAADGIVVADDQGRVLFYDKQDPDGPTRALVDPEGLARTLLAAARSHTTIPIRRSP